MSRLADFRIACSVHEVASIASGRPRLNDVAYGPRDGRRAGGEKHEAQAPAITFAASDHRCRACRGRVGGQPRPVARRAEEPVLTQAPRAYGPPIKRGGLSTPVAGEVRVLRAARLAQKKRHGDKHGDAQGYANLVVVHLVSPLDGLRIPARLPSAAHKKAHGGESVGLGGFRRCTGSRGTTGCAWDQAPLGCLGNNCTKEYMNHG